MQNKKPLPFVMLLSVFIHFPALLLTATWGSRQPEQLSRRNLLHVQHEDSTQTDGQTSGPMIFLLPLCGPFNNVS